jgi:hypothetical protein
MIVGKGSIDLYLQNSIYEVSIPAIFWGLGLVGMTSHSQRYTSNIWILRRSRVRLPVPPKCFLQFLPYFVRLHRHFFLCVRSTHKILPFDTKPAPRKPQTDAVSSDGVL